MKNLNTKSTISILLIALIPLVHCFGQIRLNDANENWLQANKLGLEILKTCKKNHGDIDKNDLKIALSIICKEGKNRGQSYEALPPYQHFYIKRDFFIDRKNNFEFLNQKNPFPGFVFEDFSIVDKNEKRYYNKFSKSFFEINSVGFENYRHFPFRFLKLALENPGKVFYVKELNHNGEKLHEILFAGNNSFKLLISSEENLIRQVETFVTNQPYGDGTAILEFRNYQKVEGLSIPSTIISGSSYESWGELFNVYEVEILSEKEVKIPSEKSRKSYRDVKSKYRRMAEVVKLAEKVFLIENISENTKGDDYNVLFIEFQDYILVGEAPISNDISKKAMRLIQQTIPDKPIRYLLQSHHHQDHIGGIREYIAKDITIITTPGNRQLFEKIAKANFKWNPDSQAKDPKDLSLKIIENRYTFSDADIEVQIMDIGPIPHAKEMLMAYIPQYGILWQVDMVSFKEWGLNIGPSRILKERIKSLGLKVKLMAGVHGQVMQGQALKKYLSKK